VGDKGLFIADYNNKRINYFNFQTKTLSYLLGAADAKIYYSFNGFPNAIFVSKNGDFMLFASNVRSHILIANLTASTVRIFAGFGDYSAQIDGVGTAARFNYISSIVGTADESKFYVADNAWRAVRLVTFPGAVVTTIPVAFVSDFVNFMTLSMDGLFLYTVVVDSGRNYYNKINMAAGVYTTYGLNGAGYLDGRMAVVKFSKPTSCHIGYFYNFSTCSRCGVGEYQNVSVQTSLVCVKCPAGTYGSAVDSAVCRACALGKYSSAIGATTQSACQSCAAGGYVSYTAASVCDTCAVGKYATAVGANSSSVCQSCSPGAYTSISGSTVCQNCTAGNYSNSGASACTLCGPGLVSHDGAASCYAMPVCGVGTYGQYPLCNPCPANTNSSLNHTSTLLDCRCLAGFVCTYTKQINVVLTLNSITWDMTTIAGLSQNAIIDAIAQAAGVSREKVVISSMFSGRRLLRLQRREVLVTVHGAEGLDIDSVYRQLNVSHVAWTHRHSVHVARELI
jgi:hypothetical protein